MTHPTDREALKEPLAWAAARAALSVEPAPSRVVPYDAIGLLVRQAIDQAVANGANSVSMPDEIVAVAAWLAASPPPTTAQLADRTCIECAGPLQWRCPACRIAQSRNVAAQPTQGASTPYALSDAEDSALKRALLKSASPAERCAGTTAAEGTMGEQFIRVIASIWHEHPDYSIRQTLDALNARFPASTPAEPDRSEMAVAPACYELPDHLRPAPWELRRWEPLPESAAVQRMKDEYAEHFGESLSTPARDELPEPVAWQWRKRHNTGNYRGEPYYVWSEWEQVVAPYMDAPRLAKSDPENYEVRPVFSADQMRAAVEAERAKYGVSPCGHPASLMLRSAETGKSLYCQLCDEISGRRDAEAMERTLSAERDALRAEVGALRGAADRWETARRMGPQQWADVWKLNMRTGKPFDEIIDDLRPFICHDSAPSGAGG